MGLRTRNPDGYEAAFRWSEKLYRAHVGRVDEMSQRDLWKFFRWDFVHYGGVRHLRGWDLTYAVAPGFPRWLAGPVRPWHEGLAT